MTRIGPTLVIVGELLANDDIHIEGRIDGPVWCEGHSITLSPDAVVTGDLIARDITVAGRVSGMLLGTDVVDIRATATVAGRIVANRLILDDGGIFNGEVQPSQVEAALTVARHRRK